MENFSIFYKKWVIDFDESSSQVWLWVIRRDEKRKNKKKNFPEPLDFTGREAKEKSDNLSGFMGIWDVTWCSQDQGCPDQTENPRISVPLLVSPENQHYGPPGPGQLRTNSPDIPALDL